MGLVEISSGGGVKRGKGDGLLSYVKLLNWLVGSKP